MPGGGVNGGQEGGVVYMVMRKLLRSGGGGCQGDRRQDYTPHTIWYQLVWVGDPSIHRLPPHPPPFFPSLPTISSPPPPILHLSLSLSFHLGLPQIGIGFLLLDSSGPIRSDVEVAGVRGAGVLDVGMRGAGVKEGGGRGETCRQSCLHSSTHGPEAVGRHSPSADPLVSA